MADPVVKIKRSSVPGKTPTTEQLTAGEFAINTYDGKIFIEQDQGGVGVGTTVITVNPWNVGLGSTAYNTYFTAGNVGVGTTNPTSKLHIIGDARIVGTVTATAFVGDGSGLTNISASGSVSISTNTTNSNQLIPYVTSFGSTTGLGATNNLVFNPSTGNLGIGNTNPSVKLQVGGVIGFNDTNVRIGGTDTGSSITTGTNNIFIGSLAGFANTTGGDNVFVGQCAGRSNATGCYNVFIGRCTGRLNTTGNHNTFIGLGAGDVNTTGTSNVFIGYWAGLRNTTGGCNNFFGWRSGWSNTTGGSNNFFGVFAGIGNTSGCNNNFFGASVGFNNDSGDGNNFFGRVAGYCNTTGSSNNFLGIFAGYCNTTGNNNQFLGSYSGISSTASRKIIIGSGNITGYFDSPDTNKDTQFAIGVRTDANLANYWLVGNQSFNVGIGTTNPTSKLTVGGDARIVGTVTATAFVGDGSGLTNISASGSGVAISTNTTNSNQYLTYATGFGTVSGLGATNSLVFNPSTGYLGIGTTNPSYNLHVIGSFGATTKSFSIPHPTKKGRTLQYGSLESPYHGIRLTGKGTIENGKSIIELPDYISAFVKEEEINIQVTNIRHGEVLWVENVDVENNNFTIQTKKTRGTYEFYWDFTAIRKDVADLEVEV